MSEEKEIKETEETTSEAPVDVTAVAEEAVAENATQEPVSEETNEVVSEKKVSNEKNVEDITPEKKVFKRILQGKVVSSTNNKTITVLVERQVSHPIYKKYFKMSKKMVAHDETNDANQGDTVRIKESRPISKTKRWTLEEIVERAK